MTVAELRRLGRERLRAAGIESAGLDCDLLLAHALRIDRTALHAHPERTLDPRQLEAWRGLMERREQREPLPYLLGAWEFMGLRLAVSPAVLIPRPETEILVEAVAERVAPHGTVLDVGAGSGCVALGLARLIPTLRVLALEPSAAALEVARANARAHRLEGRIEFVQGTFPADARGPYQAIVANPPYIPSAALAALPPEVRDYEPREALDGGPDGLRLIRQLVSESPALLTPGGWLAMEVETRGDGQAATVETLLREQAAWDEIVRARDLAGRDRVVLARRSA